MTAKTQTERLAVIEEKLEQNASEHREIKGLMNRIDCKLDTVIGDKADKSELEKLDARFWGIVITLLFMALGIIFAIFK